MNEKHEKSMLVKFEVNNLMAIRFAEVEFSEDGGLVVLGGQNGSGKSSLLQALQFALGGKKALDKDPLKYGADKGFVNVEFKGRAFSIRRTINDSGGETLTVKGEDGKPIKQPQKVLNDIMGAMGIDPSVIWGMKDAEISATLRDTMDLDLTGVDAEEKKIADDRAVAKKLVVRAETTLQDTDTFDDAPAEKISISALLAEQEAAKTANDKLQSMSDIVTQNTNRQTEIDAEVFAAQEKIEGLLEESKQLNSETTSAMKFFNDNDAVDLTGINARLQNFEETNRQVDANALADSRQRTLKNERANVQRLNGEIEEIRQKRKDMIAAAEFPLDGVEFDSNGMFLLDGKPWHAWSDGERLLAAFEIAAAMSPGINTVVMRQGSLFDDENKKVIATIAQERGFLVLMEVVGDSEDVSIFMDDGQVTDRR